MVCSNSLTSRMRLTNFISSSVATPNLPPSLRKRGHKEDNKDSPHK
jgi:hypothetical protein